MYWVKNKLDIRKGDLSLVRVAWKDLLKLKVLLYIFELQRSHLRFQANILVKYLVGKASEEESISNLKLLSPSLNIGSTRDWNESTLVPRVLGYFPNAGVVRDSSTSFMVLAKLINGYCKYWLTVLCDVQKLLVPELALVSFYLYVSKVLRNENYSALVVSQSLHGIERHLLDTICFQKSVEILHGVPAGSIEVGSTDIIIVNGFHDEQRLLDSGIPSNKILVLGVSKYDYLVNIDKDKYQINGDVLLLDPADGQFDDFQSIHQKLLVWYKKNYGSTLYIKPHPRQKMNEINFLTKLSKTIGLNLMVYPKSIEETIKNFKRAVVLNSTSGVEFGFTGKKLIVPMFLGETQIDYEHLPNCEVWYNEHSSILKKGQGGNYYFKNCGKSKEYWKHVIS